MPVANIVYLPMLDFRYSVVPRLLRAMDDAFGNNCTEEMYGAEGKILERLRELTAMTAKLASAIAPTAESLPERKGQAQGPTQFWTALSHGGLTRRAWVVIPPPA